jgi:hypothetical protein
MIWLALLLLLNLQQVPPQLESQVKAAFLYNFAQYTEWPKTDSEKDGNFHFCIAGDGVTSALRNTVRGERVNGRTGVVRTLEEGEDPLACHVLFISEKQTARRKTDLLNAVGDAPVLTVGEGMDFLRRGGIIRFLKSGNRIRFEINPDAAARASLRFSSRLLRLAEISKNPEQ